MFHLGYQGSDKNCSSAENNIPIAFSDKLNKTLRDLFPDSKIVEQY